MARLSSNAAILFEPTVSSRPSIIPSSSASPMRLALEQAVLAARRSEVPVGAVMVDTTTGEVISLAHNLTETHSDPTAHAEILVIREACSKLASPRLLACDLYVTLEPCAMCAAAIAHARVRRLYFGAYDVKSGGVDHGARIFHQDSCHHRPEVVGGMEESASSALLKTFFESRR